MSCVRSREKRIERQRPALPLQATQVTSSHAFLAVPIIGFDSGVELMTEPMDPQSDFIVTTTFATSATHILICLAYMFICLSG